ncbi:hypothetical protein WME85_38065 [Sorangium sp. So ce1153]
MHRFAHLKLKFASLTLAAGAALAASAAACGDSASPARPPQSTLEVHARLDATGVGDITQMPDGRVIIGFHPFYTPEVQVALLNPDRKSTTPYPSTAWQSCKNADGSWRSDFNACLDWVLGLHTDQNGVLWLLDSARSTDKAAGRPAGLVPKLVGWNTHQNELARVIPISPEATMTESQHNDFVVDLKHNVIVIADEAIGEGSGGVEEDVILVGEDDEEVSLAARPGLLVLPLPDRPRLDGDPGGVHGEAEGGLEGLFARGLDDGAQRRARVFGVAAHCAAIERRPLKLQLLLQSIERDAEQVLAGEDVRNHRRREERPPEQLLRKRRRDEDRACLALRRRRRRVERCGGSARLAGRCRVLRADARSGRRRRDFSRDDLERGSFPLARAARIRDGPLGLVHDACEHNAAHSAALVAESRGLLDPDARRRRIELRTGELDADDGQVRLGQVATALAAGPSFRPSGVVVLPLVARLALGGVECLLETLDLEEHRVERQLLGAHLGALRLGHEQSTSEKLQLLERTGVGAPELRERIARSDQLALCRCELRFELRDALLLGRRRRLGGGVGHDAAIRKPSVLVERIRAAQWTRRGARLRGLDVGAISMPSSSVSSVASSTSTCVAPSVGGSGSTNAPRSRRLENRQSPLPSKKRILMLVRRLPMNANSAPQRASYPTRSRIRPESRSKP